MSDKEMLKKRLEAANFISNNGRVLRTINVLRYKSISSHFQNFNLLDTIQNIFLPLLA